MTLITTIKLFLYYMIIPSVLGSILCCVSIYILYKNAVSMKEMKQYFLISFITGTVLYTGSYILILPVLSATAVAQLMNNKDTNKIKILITIYAVYCTNLVYTLVYTFSGAELYDIPIKNTLIQFIIMLFILSAVCLIINFAAPIKKVNRKSSAPYIRLKMILITSVPFSIIIYLIFITPRLVNKDQSEFIYGNFLPEALPLITLMLINIIIYNYDKSVEIEARLKRELEEKREIEEYSHCIEDMYSETRRFKHDYINMLAPLKEYIDKADIEGLKHFFYENVINMDKDIKWSSTNIDKLKFIKDSGLKAILSMKLIKALSLNIDIKVDIVEDISSISMNIMELCRILGILMDNAIEAAEECEYPKLSLCIVNKRNYTVTIIQNNFWGQKPVIHKIYKEGFSTKGEGRGLGLYTVKKIIDNQYDNVLLNTSIEDNMFIQELWIKSVSQ